MPKALEAMACEECQGLLQLALVLHHDHAYPAATARGLDEQGVAYLAGHRLRLFKGADLFLGARHHEDAGLAHLGPGRHLVPHRFNHLAGRADEPDAFLLAGGGEPGILREEPVAGVDGGGAALLGHLDDPGYVEVALSQGRSAQQVGFVRVLGEESLLVRGGVDGHRLDAELPAGPHYPDGDLPAVGHQDLVRHSAPPRRGLRRP